MIADLHIHSFYSRATSKQCIPEFLELYARRKGIGLLGTGDFTHPAWRAELSEKMEIAGEGVYALKPEYRLNDPFSPAGAAPRFVVSGEISSIYKKHGKTRKVHNLILLPGLEAAEDLSHKLEAVGNVHSDGRPILGLDSRDLLEITLEACPEAIFIPAHIWTPHFSMFGSFSHFQSIEECFEDLTPYIHALETGLSSDPAMNWRISALDGYTLVSNSDAHSPSKLGREANLFDIEPSYPALANALEKGRNGGFAGMIEFFPEEGKYHLDGHRNCGVCLTPEETERCGGICPVCGKKITVGVLNRLSELADRGEGYRPDGALPFESLAPLSEVIAGSIGVSSGKKLEALYEGLIRELGQEFYILREAPLDDVERVAGPCVREGIRRLRQGEVKRKPGFDGEYGVITLLDRAEIETLNGQFSLFAGIPALGNAQKRRSKSASKTSGRSKETARAGEDKQGQVSGGESVGSFEEFLAGLNEEQREAALCPARSVAVIAGPGTGKTKTLVSRIAYLLKQGVRPSAITAVTFTNKAAAELKGRLEAVCENKRAVSRMNIGTFHAICLKLLKESGKAAAIIAEEDALAIASEICREHHSSLAPSLLLKDVSNRKNGSGEFESDSLSAEYCTRLEASGFMDLDDVLLRTLALWEDEAAGGLSATSRKRFQYLLVDEFQDVNAVQLRLISAWRRENESLFVIGDPDQSIYGFRGSDAACFDKLFADLPDTQRIALIKNYRSTPEITNGALGVIEKNGGGRRVLAAQAASGAPIRCVSVEDALSEGIFIAKEINRMVGGIDMLDSHSTAFGSACRQVIRDFSDIAVLYRTRRQAQQIGKCLQREGVPYVVSGRDDFLTDPTVRGTICYFRFLNEPQELPSLRLALKLLWQCPEDIAEQTLKTLDAGMENGILEWNYLAQEFSAESFLQQWSKLTPIYLSAVKKQKPRKLLEQWAQDAGFAVGGDYESLLNAAMFCERMSDFLDALTLGKDADLTRSPGGKLYRSGAVRLMTLHAAKGLEFPVVFLAGANRDVIPYTSEKHPTDIFEERRLFYVGMTRAKEELLLLTAKEPSEFIGDIPESVLHRETAHKRKNSRGSQTSLFDI